MIPTIQTQSDVRFSLGMEWIYLALLAILFVFVFIKK